MQTVSAAWKSNQEETLVSESFVEVSMDISDPDAVADASADDNGSESYADTAQIVDGTDKTFTPYLSLEQNLWLLDGSRRGLPESDYGDTGFVGNAISDGDCLFYTNPLITISFTEEQTTLIPGLTFVWGAAYGEFPIGFIVRAYLGVTLLATETVEDNASTMSVLTVELTGYDKIEIEIVKWCLPGHRARLEEVILGWRLVYTKNDLLRYTHSDTVDPLSLTLPKSEIQISIDNSDRSYDPNNPEGMTQYLMERQKIRSKYGYKINGLIEWIDGATCFLSEWDAPQNGLSADFTARDLLEFMSDLYYEGLYAPAGVSLYDLAEAVFQAANLPLQADGSVRWEIDSSLESISTVAPLPVCPQSECLQLIANAGCCVLYQDRSGVLHIEPASDTETDYGISNANSFRRSEVKLSKPIKQVDVMVHQFFAGDADQELFNGEVDVDGTVDIVLIYSEPATAVAAVATGGTLNSAEYFTNACRLNITAVGTVGIVVTGDTLKSSESKYTVLNAGVTDGESPQIKNELIATDARAAIVGDWVLDYLKNRMTLRSDWRSDPRLDALDIIANENDYNSNWERMTTVELSYNGAFRGSGEGRVIGVVD
jgi:hypothetical protein